VNFLFSNLAAGRLHNLLQSFVRRSSNCPVPQLLRLLWLPLRYWIVDVFFNIILIPVVSCSSVVL